MITVSTRVTAYVSQVYVGYKSTCVNLYTLQHVYPASKPCAGVIRIALLECCIHTLLECIVCV